MGRNDRLWHTVIHGLTAQASDAPAKAAIYAGVSSDGGRQSPANQLQQLRELCSRAFATGKGFISSAQVQRRGTNISTAYSQNVLIGISLKRCCQKCSASLFPSPRERSNHQPSRSVSNVLTKEQAVFRVPGTRLWSSGQCCCWSIFLT